MYIKCISFHVFKITLEDQVVESLQIKFSITFQNNQMNYTNLSNHRT
jgi:hypothetical protein